MLTAVGQKGEVGFISLSPAETVHFTDISWPYLNMSINHRMITYEKLVNYRNSRRLRPLLRGSE
jgi:hypothetical protein